MLNRFMLFSTLFLNLTLSCTNSNQQLVDQARGKLDQGEFTEAISLLDLYLKEAGTDAKAFNMRGVAFFNQQKNSKALEDFTQAILLDSSNYQYFYNRGNVKRMLRDFAGAVTDYERSIALDATHYEIFLNRALALMNDSQFEQALPDFQQALQLSNGQDKNVYLYRGEAFLRLEAFDKAEKDFKKCLSLDKNTPAALFGLATCLIAKNSEDTAEACQMLKGASALGYSPADEMQKLYCE